MNTVVPLGGRLCQRFLTKHSVMVGVLQFPAGFAVHEGDALVLVRMHDAIFASPLHDDPQRDEVGRLLDSQGVNSLLHQSLWRVPQDERAMMVRCLEADLATNTWVVFGPSIQEDPSQSHAWWDVGPQGQTQPIASPCSERGMAIGQLLQEPVWPLGGQHNQPLFAIGKTLRKAYDNYHRLLVMASSSPHVAACVDAIASLHLGWARAEISAGKIDLDFAHFLAARQRGVAPFGDKHPYRKQLDGAGWEVLAEETSERLDAFVVMATRNNELDAQHRQAMELAMVEAIMLWSSPQERDTTSMALQQARQCFLDSKEVWAMVVSDRDMAQILWCACVAAGYRKGLQHLIDLNACGPLSDTLVEHVRGYSHVALLEGWCHPEEHARSRTAVSLWMRKCLELAPSSPKVATLQQDICTTMHFWEREDLDALLAQGLLRIDDPAVVNKLSDYVLWRYEDPSWMEHVVEALQRGPFDATRQADALGLLTLLANLHDRDQTSVFSWNKDPASWQQLVQRSGLEPMLVNPEASLASCQEPWQGMWNDLKDTSFLATLISWAQANHARAALEDHVGVDMTRKIAKHAPKM